MQLQEENNDLMSSPSFNYYYSDSLTAMAAAKVSREFKQEQVHELSYVDEEDFEFSMELSDEELNSGKQIDLDLDHEDRQFVFPIFDNEQRTKDDAVEEIDNASSFRIQVQKLFVDDVEESSSSSSVEAYELEARHSGIFCMWRSKPDVAYSPLTKSKKSSSTGSGLRRWRIWSLLRRNHSEGKASAFLLCHKKVETSKQKWNAKSNEITRVAGKLKTPSSPSFHELFYVQKRAEQKGDKMKTFLPYRQDLLGFFVKINRIGVSF
ncbi:unnamed protein product [Lactuca saligna]|uniref:Uncharacterized protein n=1 Tax=Lactuca saligna TaxID=75948 RepID=A0AA35Z0Q2_LACSI|nr:unnamed protein product [Lactuca saligna]